MSDWRTRAQPMNSSPTPAPSWRERAEPVTAPPTPSQPGPDFNVPGDLMGYLSDQGVPDDLMARGVTADNAANWADLHIQKARREIGDSFSPNQEQAIFDLYKTLSGRRDLSSRNFVAEQRADSLEKRRDTLGGRVLDAGAAYNRSLGTTGASLVGTVDPQLGQQLQQNIDATYATDPKSRAAFAGGLIGEGVKLAGGAAAAGLTAAPGLALGAFYAAQGFGGTRVGAEQLRRGGKEVSALEEFGTAAGVGAVEGVSGLVGAKLFGAIGSQLRAAGPAVSQAFGAGGGQGARAAIRQALGTSLSTGGLVLAEGAEEAITQGVTNLIVQYGMDPEQALLEGVKEAMVAGMILAPFGAGGLAAGQHGSDIPGASVDTELRDSILAAGDNEGSDKQTLALPPAPARFNVSEDGVVADRLNPVAPAQSGLDRFRAREGRAAALTPRGGQEQATEPSLVGPRPATRPEPGSTVVTNPDRAETLASEETQARLNDPEVRALVERGYAPEEAVQLTYGSVPSVSQNTGLLDGTSTVQFQPDQTGRSREAEMYPEAQSSRVTPGVQKLVDTVQQAVGPDVQIKVVDDLPGIRGFVDHESGVMYIRNGSEKEGVFETVIHEAMHATDLDLESEIGSPRTRKRLEKEYLDNFREFARRNPDNARVQRALADLEADPRKRSTEAVATLAGRLATDPTFAAQLYRRDPGFVGKVINLFRRMVNTVTGRQKDIDTLAQEILSKIEKNTGVAVREGASFQPERQVRRSRLETHQTDLDELVGKRSRATSEAAQAKLDADIAAKREIIAAIEAPKRTGSSFLPDSLKVPGVRPSKGRFTLSQGIEDFIAPISTRLANISPLLYRRLQSFEMRSRVQREDLQREVGDFLRNKNKALTAEQSTQFDLHVFNGDFDKARALLQSADPDLLQGFADTERVLQSIFKSARRAGIDVGFKQNYWPREVKNYDRWREQVVGDKPSPIKDAIRKAEDKRGRKLTPDEEIEIANRVLQGYGPRKPGDTNPRTFRRRTQATIDKSMLPLYRNADQALMGYINRSVHTIEKARLFGKGDVGEDIMDSIGRWTASLVSSGEITHEQERTVKDLITSRFTTGEVAPGALVRTIRDIGYLTVLANPVSAVTQLGDLFLAGYRAGAIPALKAAVSTKKIRMETLGIERIAVEFSDPGKLAKVLDTAMRASGFTWIDRLGKETLLNAALRKHTRAAKAPGSRQFTDFKREFGATFGKDFDGLVSDLASEKVSENVRLLLFMELAGIQPITLSEMPKKYLDAPNGRIFYMLKTFTIKQLDMLRRNAFTRINKGDMGGAADLLRYAMIFGVGNAAADLLKDWILGRDVKWSDTAIDGVLRLFGGSKFLADSSIKDGPGRAFFSMLLPPTPAVDDVTRDVLNAPGIWSGDKGAKSVRNIPIIGKLLYWRAGAGKGRAEAEAKTAERRRRDEIRDLAVAALDEGDRTAATAVIQKWNEEERPGWMEAMTMRSVVNSRRGRLNAAFTKAKADAATAVLAGDTRKARKIIDTYNKANPRTLTLRHAQAEARKLRARGRTE